MRLAYWPPCAARADAPYHPWLIHPGAKERRMTSLRKVYANRRTSRGVLAARALAINLFCRLKTARL